jgi:hypothetical protein
MVAGEVAGLVASLVAGEKILGVTGAGGCRQPSPGDLEVAGLVAGAVTRPPRPATRPLLCSPLRAPSLVSGADRWAPSRSWFGALHATSSSPRPLGDSSGGPSGIVVVAAEVARLDARSLDEGSKLRAVDAHGPACCWQLALCRQRVHGVGTNAQPLGCLSHAQPVVAHARKRVGAGTSFPRSCAGHRANDSRRAMGTSTPKSTMSSL